MPNWHARASAALKIVTEKSVGKKKKHKKRRSRRRRRGRRPRKCRR